MIKRFFVVFIALLFSSTAIAQSADEMARKLQNPLANIKALITDNSVGFNTGDSEGTSFGFQFQPVYAIDFAESGFTMIPRAVIPIVGIEPGTKLGRIGEDGMLVPGSGSSIWGLADSMLQVFFAPHTESPVKWGIGPQVSFPTHTDDKLIGPDWGAGISGVLAGAFSETVTFAALINNHWGNNGKFEVGTIQPMVYYNFPNMPGVALGYNAPITADWNADSNNRWTVPIGLTLSKTFDIGNGQGLDVGAGPYYNVESPDGGADWTIRWALSLIF